MLAAVVVAADFASALAEDAAGQSRAAPRVELYAGAEAFRHAWSLYTGATLAPFGSILEDGLRLRAAGGYGAYSYSGARAFGPWSFKLYGGVTLSQHHISPDDPETVIRGQGLGGKVVLESWWDMTERAWTSLDLSWASLYDSYSARARLGWRLTPQISTGLEAGAGGNVEGDIARVGAFVRYEWAGGELAVSGGVANDALLQGAGSPDIAEASVPYATLSWLMRF